MQRVKAIDILRGLIMVLMAIDHVRVYAGVPAGSPEPVVFFTRWITHFCTPGFVFFAGTSAFLYRRKYSKKEITFFLLSRGILLIVLELTVIRFFWTFNFNYTQFTLAGVIWMIGWCMVIMAGLVKLKPLLVGIIGLFIVGGQQLFSFLPKLFPATLHENSGKITEFIYPAGLNGPEGITILYVLVPWLGVMALGYWFGMVFQMDEKKRNRICWWTGGIAVLVFLIFAFVNAYRHPSVEFSFPLQILNQSKYPASQLYILMTLGPLLLLVPTVGKMKGWVSRLFSVFGKVPMFYYLLHIPLIHVTALLVNAITKTGIAPTSYSTAPYTWIEPQNQWSLWLLYLVFFADVVLLYFVCKWYVRYKQKNAYKKWLQYL